MICCVLWFHISLNLRFKRISDSTSKSVTVFHSYPLWFLSLFCLSERCVDRLDVDINGTCYIRTRTHPCCYFIKTEIMFAEFLSSKWITCCVLSSVEIGVPAVCRINVQFYTVLSEWYFMCALMVSKSGFQTFCVLRTLKGKSRCTPALSSMQNNLCNTSSLLLLCKSLLLMPNKI